MCAEDPDDSDDSPQLSDIGQWTNERGVVRFRVFTHRNILVQDEIVPRGTVLQVYGKSVNSREPRQWFTTYRGQIVELPQGSEGTVQGALWSPLFLIEKAGEAFAETKLLGKGGFGRVVRATHPYTLGTEYAKKIITQAVPDLDALRREIAGLTQFTDDPHIAEHIVDGMAGGAVTIVMLPIASRGSLADVLGALRRIPSDHEDYGERIHEILRWTYCLAKSLARVHDKGIVHGDIKPENILIHHDNIIYSDFGVASARAAMTTSSSPSRDFSGPKGDVFALGWVLYQMIVAATPSTLSDNALPSYRDAKIMAWDDRDAFLRCVDEAVEDPRKPYQILGSNREAFGEFTKELLGIITRRMIVLQADGRADCKDIAKSIRSVMDRLSLAPQICCEGSYELLGKPW